MDVKYYQMNSERIEELSLKIREAREGYYNLNTILSDQEYDALIDELKSLDPNHKELILVGAAPTEISVWEKVPHKIPMGSLNKVNSEAEFLEWAEKLNTGSIHITHKIDGSSMELVYQKGMLISAVTRGDGMIGEEVLSNMSKVPSIPKKLPIEIDVIVRGEIVILKKVFEEKYSESYANPRNTAAGKVRDKKGGGKDCVNLNFLAYWMIKEIDQPSTLSYAFKELKSLGFEVPEAAACTDKEYIVKIFKGIDRESVPYEIDGMVVSVNNLNDLQELGELNLRPNGQVAWKFDPSMRESRVIDVKWQVGSSGRVTGVAVVEPINIGGVTITNVSLHNLSMFKDLNLHKGCRVLISRRNDCIPYLEKNLSDDQV
jgi:DNA ligase (NAD+)